MAILRSEQQAMVELFQKHVEENSLGISKRR